ncbi:MAG: hypothetical protein AB1640_17155 [bacterium]
MEEERMSPEATAEAAAPEGLACDACDAWYPFDGPHSSCLHFMTKREIEILDSMREVKRQAQDLKRRLSGLDRGAPEAHALSESLAALHEQWQELDRQRIAAAGERMRLLGHPE